MHRDASARTTVRILLAFFCVYLFWGSSFVAIRFTVQQIHPATVAGLRYCIAGVLLMAWLLVRGVSVRITRRDLIRVTGLGLLMFACNTVLLNYAATILPAGFTALIISTIPLFVALLNPSLPESGRTSPIGRIAVCTGFLGISVLLERTFRSGALTREALIACAALLLAAFAWALGSVLLRRTHFTAPELVTTCWQMLIGGAVDLVIGFSYGGPQSSHWTMSISLSVLYLAVFGTLAGYTSYVYLLRKVPVATAATYAYVNPIVAMLLGWALLSEAPDNGQWVGMVIVLASVAAVIRAKPEMAPVEARAIELSPVS